MKRIALIAAALAALAWTAQAPGRTLCTPGVRTVGGVTYRTFCGPAKATLHAGGQTYAFAGGNCARTGTTFTINIGTITLPPGSPKYRYFGITVFTGHDGTFANAAITWQFPGGRRGSLISTKVVLSGGRTKGTFSGRLLGASGTGSGTFRCS